MSLRYFHLLSFQIHSFSFIILEYLIEMSASNALNRLVNIIVKSATYGCLTKRSPTIALTVVSVELEAEIILNTVKIAECVSTVLCLIVIIVSQENTCRIVLCVKKICFHPDTHHMRCLVVTQSIGIVIKSFRNMIHAVQFAKKQAKHQKIWLLHGRL